MANEDISESRRIGDATGNNPSFQVISLLYEGFDYFYPRQLLTPRKHF